MPHTPACQPPSPHALDSTPRAPVVCGDPPVHLTAASKRSPQSIESSRHGKLAKLHAQPLVQDCAIGDPLKTEPTSQLQIEKWLEENGSRIKEKPIPHGQQRAYMVLREQRFSLHAWCQMKVVRYNTHPMLKSEALSILDAGQPSGRIRHGILMESVRQLGIRFDEWLGKHPDCNAADRQFESASPLTGTIAQMDSDLDS